MNNIQLKNIFDNVPENIPEEIFERLIVNSNFHLERIISQGHNSPKDFWYDQDTNEFVILISGSAELHFFDGEKFFLKPGDYFIIPANTKHRIERTDSEQKTFWLTLHF
jgi:cupin 2 domain-containing protein